jgi:hypothetical protein
MISNDTDNFVIYSKHEGRFTVTKALFEGCSDTQELYKKEIAFQVLLAEKGLAPRLLKKDIKGMFKGRRFIMWISEDAGLPIEEQDVAEANKVLTQMWDSGITLTGALHKGLFVKGFDGKVRLTDFKHAEYCENPTRSFLQWTES